MVSVKWVDGLRFVASTDEKHSLDMDAEPESGGAGTGFKPLELVLVGLGGCTAMDIVWILRRQRQKLTGLEVKVSGTRREDEPRYYERIHLDYAVQGEGIREEAVKRAIRLSEEKYCSVLGMITPKAKVTSSYRVEEESRI